MTALRKNRVNHAYLFSGPRGCGKTTSARILARCLNCAEGPTDTPCGKCPSCIELARGGSGSLDVIEIDAASHGGVDDARDLRERATFAPVRDRYKIFIIDEAHMVTSAGFNALLKIVEEPPEHIKFIFATTEPDKVIGTIRSRTHHYPFRLVPPEPLIKYLELLCHQENVPVAPGVLSLVIRAGGGSVRDSLSVLDQLMAGAGPNGLDYELAVALLGYTHASLLDDVVDAVAAADSATVFRAVDRVIQTGHDPRRFVEDLLERFRDLIIVQAMPESAQSILRGMPEDQIARMRNQATNLGAAELSRAADVTNTALTEMTGATSPRLHLELLCARILLPSAEQTERGIAARIDRVERRLNYAGDAVIPAAASASPQAGAAPAAGSQAQQVPAAQTVAPAAQQTAPATPAAMAPMTPQQPAERPVEHQTAAAPAGPSAPVAPATVPSQEHQRREPQQQQQPDSGARTSLTAPRVSTNDWPVEDRSVSGRPTGPSEGQQAPVQTPAAERNPAATPTGQAAPAAQPAPASQPAPATQSVPAPEARPAAIPSAPTPSGGDVETLRRAWPDVLQALAKIKRSTWALVEPNAQVAQYDAQVLTLAFTTSGLAGAFGRADHAENLRQAIHKTIGIDCQIVAVAGANSSASSEPNPKARTSRDTPATNTQEPVSDGAAHLASGSDTTPVAAAPAPAPAAATAVDAAWGLAPASRPEQESSARKAPAQDAPAHKAPAQETPAREPAAPAPTDHAAGISEAPTGPADNVETPSWQSVSPADRESVWLTGPKTPEEPPAGPQATPQAGPRASVPDTAGDYSYPDDDWGPPLDEDAPPLEEEPPADWEPTPRYEAPAAPAQAQADARPRTPSRPQASPQPTQATKPTNATETPSRPGPAQDPWSRAVEHAPGTWVVGTESNVGGKAKANGNSSDHQAAQPSQNESAPQYEPAAAQIPATAQAPTAGTPDIGSETAEPSTYGQPTSAGNNGSSGWDVAPPSEWPGAGATQTQQKAPAWPLSSLEPQEAHGSVATLEGDAPSGGRPVKQSLYQRLTNSPEAQRGRVQAPAHPHAQPTSVAEDIPSPEDETIEESRVFGRAAVERILGGKLIEERSLDGSPLHMR
ncbi:AAA family ATPase [Paenarthrobacter ureafaciens]|nr:AAA family ATPase [Paenarthrobacter ureafaciens]